MATDTANITGPRDLARPRLRTPQAAELAGRIRLQLVFRLVIAMALLIVTALLHASGRTFPQTYEFGAMYVAVFALFAAALVAAVLWTTTSSVAGLQRLAVGEVVADLAATTVLVHVTGGVNSLFTFIYALQILNAAIVLRRRGVFIMSGTAAVAYGLTLAAVYFDLIPPFHPELGGGAGGAQVLIRITVASVGFVLTGSLSSYLAEQLRVTREELREQRIDLRKLEALNQLIVDNIGSGLLTVDHAGLVTSMNPFAQEVLGVELGHVYERPLATLFATDSEAKITTSALPRDELIYRRPDGKELVLGFSSSPLRDDAGEAIGQIIVFRDLTDLRDLEERVRRDDRLATVGRLAAGIAHEIRNPLASISGSVQLLQGENESSVDGDEEAQRLMEIVVRETDRLNGLISEFLSYVRPEKVRRVGVNLTALARDTIEELRERPDSKAELELQTEEVVKAAGDPEKLKQVMYNLLINAVDAMADGGTVRIRCDARGETVVLSITDEGPGIPEEDQGRVFDPFFTTKAGGTGLGLAIVHKIVDAHRGYIEVDSKAGSGTTFLVVLPAWTSGSTELHFDTGTQG